MTAFPSHFPFNKNCCPSPQKVRSSGLSFLYTNIRSVRSKSIPLSSLVDSSTPSIIALTETWLNEDVPDSSIFLTWANYRFFRCDRKHRKGGGVLLAVTNDVLAVPVYVSSFLECVWVSIKCGIRDLIVGVFYRPPDANTDFSSEFTRVLNLICSRFPNSLLLILGDFNFPNISWSTQSVTDGQTEAHNFVQSCLDFSLVQLISRPTRSSSTSANILDLVFTNDPDILSVITHLDGLSDHDILTGILHISPIKRKTTKKQIRCYNRADYTSINNELFSFADNFLEEHGSRSVEDNWVIFKNALTNLINRFIPIITIKTENTAPWYNQRLRRLNNKKKRLYRRANKRDHFSDSWLRYKRCDKEYQSLLASTRRHFFKHDLSSMLKNNPRKFWRVINPLSHPDIILTDSNNDAIPMSQCAQVLNDAFISVFTCEDTASCPKVNSIPDISMPEIIISEAGIFSLLNRLKISTASDHAGFNNKILKHLSASICPILCALFSQSLSSGCIPHDWRIAKVIPIFKSGERSSPLNYRPISLTSNICKLLEHIIHTQIINYLEDHNIIHKYQHGFRRGYSCDTQLAGFIHDIHSSLDDGSQVDAIFLDFSKAFDRVPHHRLLTKLSRLNIHSNILSWVKDFLSSRLQFTSANTCTSSFKPVTSGVPQGSVLGPLLFLIYINDLPSCVSSRIRIFADDCVIYRIISCDNDREALQTDINAINAWCSSWLMTLNHSKTKYMSFTNRASRFPTSYVLNNRSIDLVSTYKYLGVHLQPDLSWHYHIKHTLASANRSFGFLKRNLKHAPSDIRKLAFTTLIRPKIEYASAIWDPHQAYIVTDIESLQNRAARFIYSDYSFHSSVTALKRRAELPDLVHRRQLSRLSLFHKLYHHASLHDDFFEPPPVIFPRRDHSYKVKRTNCHSSAFARSFIPRTIVEWNNLPSHIASQKDNTKFQELIQQLT